MFEKEAEEYSNNWKINKNANLNFAEVVELRAVIYKAYRDGAEFGYNNGYHDAEEHYMNVIDSQHKLVDESKANEWHYVKDGIFPTHSKVVLVFTDEGVGLGIYGLDNKKWYTYDTGFEVIAWKEIVLPELKGE